MTRPGFRKGRPGGQRAAAAAGGEGFLSTSLFSQAQILHLMKSEFARARRHGHALGCVLIQVDRLAQLVDLHGAELRQIVRHELAKMVRGKTRGADLLGVTNDDRYLLVLPHTNLAQTRVVAERLHELFGTLEVTVDGKALALTASIGLAAAADQQTMFFDTLIGQAESALEWCVRHGGDRVASFGETQLLGDDEGGDTGDAGDRSAGDRTERGERRGGRGAGPGKG